MIEDILSEDGQTMTSIYYSLDEFIDAAERRINKGGFDVTHGMDDKRAGGTFNQAVKLARIGWEDKLDETLAIVESALEMVEKNHEVQSFVPAWDVQGCEVDVARYLNGEPENMIDYPLTEISKLGKVITLCASTTWSAAVSESTVIRRGQVIAAFAIILTRLGYSSELWIDQTITTGARKYSPKILVKGCNDTTDIARILYAFAHPSVFRRIGFAVQNGAPRFNQFVGAVRGRPAPPIKSLPEGTIYLPELCSGSDVPDAHTALKDLLRQAGLLAE